MSLSHSNSPRLLFYATATSQLLTLSLHDALPICLHDRVVRRPRLDLPALRVEDQLAVGVVVDHELRLQAVHEGARSEEHTSELQSPCNLVCRLLLEKKKEFSQLLEHLSTKQRTNV